MRAGWVVDFYVCPTCGTDDFLRLRDAVESPKSNGWIGRGITIIAFVGLLFFIYVCIQQLRGK